MELGLHVDVGTLSKWVPALVTDLEPSLHVMAAEYLRNREANHQNFILNLAEANNVHIVYMGEKHHEDPTVVEEFHHDMLTTLLGSKEAARESILYSYKHAFSGFAAKLSKSQAEAIEDLPGIVRVIPNRVHRLHTTNSWDFIGLQSHSPNNLLSEAKMGEDVIIGVIDTGIWPESKSFQDEGMAPVPSRWKGTCQHGEQFNSTNCNKKLIGARWFLKGAEAETKRSINSIKEDECISARDVIGHGTHTASIAAGFSVKKASYNGLAAGTARGGAPLARIAVYKACWAVVVDQGCTSADVLKAFDEAVNDGVDVISVSLGSTVPLEYIEDDTISIGSFHAVAKGIVVVCSAGNDGPFSQTVTNTAPWITTVAASTINRAFPIAITLGNNHTFMGQSMNTQKQRHKTRFHELEFSERVASKDGIVAESDGNPCKGGKLNSTLAKGKIILCFSVKENEYIDDASYSVSEAGGIGLIFAQSKDSELYPCDAIPCIKVTYDVGTQILSYIRRTRSPIVKLGNPKTVNGKWVSPRIAYFSSRGPSSLSPAVLKPDIAAPGVSILAAHSDPKNSKDGFVFLSGTSMACPHVSGVVLLIKSVHQDWSPAAIKSALITTASQTGTDVEPIMTEDGTSKQADPFDFGGGHIDPTRAAYPGLIYNMSTEDYIPFLCSMGYNTSAISNLVRHKTQCPKNNSAMDLNLPSIVIPDLKSTVTISRVVTNVGPVNSVYKAHVNPPNGIKVQVIPNILSFNSTVTSITFKVTFSSNTKVHKDYSFGSLTWTDGEHAVRSPIAVRAIIYDSYADM
ncbi:hypothetical protein J5N97_019002 [Dioscorea zingiberensis]|uniref:Uncharacterized protein n=1 Tax=Dioscorea zingiberensis TaxID=325984 RepID=A0A9D5HCF9_9LILI|nr:hypothetical protein J5N97_019002 [Dioscorea zingiberensis]